MWSTDVMLHGGDYNPDQWLHMPEILEEDARYMKSSGCNIVSLGIFAWAALEPTEGEFDFGWMDETFDRLHKVGVRINLATPSAARPAWMSQKYPEVLRVRQDRGRNLHGARHNHCYTSPVYREKLAIVIRKLAERYDDHPAMFMWHINNEYGGDCHCELCQEAFRDWLKAKYNNDLDQLNRDWWNSFWAHNYSDWSQIESPSHIGERTVHALNLEWKRFVTHQTTDFMKHEIACVREYSNKPTTANFMGTYQGLDYWRMAPYIDVVSWDAYPMWHSQKDEQGKRVADWKTALGISFTNDIYRAFKKDRPWMLMECTPSATNWQELAKLKRPGVNKLNGLQCVAHGADAVMYFQWRKSQGSFEKFHGAVVDHNRREDARVFQEITDLSNTLQSLNGVCGKLADPKVAVIYDWENSWALNDAKGPRNDRHLNYHGECVNHYRPFWEMGINVDVIESTCDLSHYDLVIAPMLYMIKPGVAEALKSFVEQGGTLVATYLTGIVNEIDLCFLNGWPGNGLKELFGIWAEEIDALYEDDENRVVISHALGKLEGEYPAKIFCDQVHVESNTTKVLATFGDDFYAGRPALTMNTFGKGKAYYVATRSNPKFYRALYETIANDLDLARALDAELPEGVTATTRGQGSDEYIFVLNYSSVEKAFEINQTLTDVETSETLTHSVTLHPYQGRVFQRS